MKPVRKKQICQQCFCLSEHFFSTWSSFLSCISLPKCLLLRWQWVTDGPVGLHHQLLLLFVTHHPFTYCLEFPITLLTAQSWEISTPLSEQGHLGRNKMKFHNRIENSHIEQSVLSCCHVCLLLSYFFPHPTRTQAGDSLWFLADGVAGKLFQHRHDH